MLGFNSNYAMRKLCTIHPPHCSPNIALREYNQYFYWLLSSASRTNTCFRRPSYDVFRLDCLNVGDVKANEQHPRDECRVKGPKNEGISLVVQLTKPM